MYYTSNQFCLLGNSYIAFRAGPRDPPVNGPAIAIPYGIATENTEGAEGTPHGLQTHNFLNKEIIIKTNRMGEGTARHHTHYQFHVYDTQLQITVNMFFWHGQFLQCPHNACNESNME